MIIYNHREDAPDTIDKFKRIFIQKVTGARWRNDDRTPEQVVEQLEALSKPLTPESIETVLPGWGTVHCDECDKTLFDVMLFGSDDYEQIAVCVDCLEKALNMMKGGL